MDDFGRLGYANRLAPMLIFIESGAPSQAKGCGDAALWLFHGFTLSMGIGFLSLVSTGYLLAGQSRLGILTG